MGIKLLSLYEIFEGVSVQNLVVTIKGDYNVKKSNDFDAFKYNIRVLLFYMVGISELYSEEKIFQLDTIDGVNIYEYVYSKLKDVFAEKGVQTEDC